MSTASTLFGSERLLVRFRDAKRTPEYIPVRELPLRLLPQLAEALHDDARLIALYLDIPLELTDSIHPESVAEILEKGDALNFPPLAATVARKTARLTRLSATMSEAANHAPPATTGATGAT